MQNIVKKHVLLIANALFYSVFFLLLGLISTDSLAKDEIDEKVVKKLQETVVEVQFQLKESISEISVLKQIVRPMSLDLKDQTRNISLNKKKIKAINATLEEVDQQLKNAYKIINENEDYIKSDKKAMEKMNATILKKAQEIKANTSGLVAQKTLIEDNSIRLYEILIKSNNLNNEVKEIERAVEKIKGSDYKQELKDELYVTINQLWHLLATILVFFAPLAFVLSSRRNNIKPLADGVGQHQGLVLVILGVFLGYFLLGFGLMYGSYDAGWVGTFNYLLGTPDMVSSLKSGILLTEFISYQIGFAMLAAMIVYMGVGQQLSSLAHLFLALFVAGILIPIFGHWAWAGHFMVDNNGWLENSGFIDQGGAVVINTVAAVFALSIVIKLAKSYPPPLKVDPKDNDPIYSSAGVLLLWLGWLGFTTGSLSIADEQIARVMLNVGLAGSAGGLIAYLHYSVFYNNKNRIIHGLSGFVTGLVAISACAQNVTHIEAIMIGALAGLLQNAGNWVIVRYFCPHCWQKRTASLIAIHGLGGIWGGICVALFSSDGNFAQPDMNQLMIQLTGIAVAIAYSIVMAKIIIFFLLIGKKNQQTEQTEQTVA